MLEENEGSAEQDVLERGWEVKEIKKLTSE